jgi:hypothetical protein
MKGGKGSAKGREVEWDRVEGDAPVERGEGKGRSCECVLVHL